MNSKSEVGSRKWEVTVSGLGSSPFRIPRSAFRVWVGVVLGAIGVSGCTDLDLALGKIPWFTTMRESPSYESYQVPRLPEAGTVPVATPIGDVPPPFTQAELTEINLTNPLGPTPEVLARGAALYERHCYVCHGSEGAGDGPVVGQGKFPFALPVHGGSAVAGYSDGYIYGIIRIGRGLMPAYGDRMTHRDRWAVVTYLRQLPPVAGGAAPTAPATPPAETGTP